MGFPRRMSLITLFSAPKPFTDPHVALIQRNAIRSWLAIRPACEVVLIDDEEGTTREAVADLGVPVVLFMENYDISRTGYHDTHDTMANIDLDYCAAVTAIAIETVADTACAPSL